MTQRLTAILPCAFTFVVMAASPPARADVLPLACEVSIGQVDPTNRELVMSRFGGAPENCLKTMFMHCSAASEENVLGVGAAMVCSMAYETLLNRVFSGDFENLLAWWRSQRGPL